VWSRNGREREPCARTRRATLYREGRGSTSTRAVVWPPGSGNDLTDRHRHPHPIPRHICPAPASPCRVTPDTLRHRHKFSGGVKVIAYRIKSGAALPIGSGREGRSGPELLTMRSAGSLTAATGASPVAVLVDRTSRHGPPTEPSGRRRVLLLLGFSPTRRRVSGLFSASSRRLFPVRCPRVLGVERLDYPSS
jgi:hypothetical protein